MKNALLIAIALIMGMQISHAQKGKVLVERNGKVGIGTSQPDELLTVKGVIHTREVKVDMKGALAPDYVFEYFFDGQSDLNPAYTRIELSDLKDYLEENKHLPGIPSAKKLSDDGMMLREMNLKLLEKIEELTLFTIEQQEQIDRLNKRLDKLQNDEK